MEVFVTNVFGRSVTCLIEETWTVQQLKDTYAQELETSSTNWYLMFNGKFLQNQKRILDYDVIQGSIIHVTYRHAHRMLRPVELRIIYHDSTTTAKDPEMSSRRGSDASNVSERKSFVMYAEADWSVGRVKREFAQMREIKDWRSLKVLENGISLREKYLLTDYHIQNDATLHFEQNMRPRRFGISALKNFITSTTHSFRSFKLI